MIEQYSYNVLRCTSKFTIYSGFDILSYEVCMHTYIYIYIYYTTVVQYMCMCIYIYIYTYTCICLEGGTLWCPDSWHILC